MWLKIGVFGIIEPNTPYFFDRWIEDIENDVKNARVIRSKMMDSCDENKVD